MAHIEIADLYGGQIETLSSRVSIGMNEVRWNMSFSLSDEALEKHKTRLAQMAETISGKLEATGDEETLFHMARDLRAPHRAPSLFDDVEYRYRDEDRNLLSEHLEAVNTRRAEARTARVLNSVRNELMAYSPLMGR